MVACRALPAAVVAGLVASLAPQALGQISLVEQERSVRTQALVSSGAESSDFDSSVGFGPFMRSLTSSVTGAGGAGADAAAFQDSAFAGGLLSGDLRASGSARTGASFVTGTSDSLSSLLVIFDLVAATSVVFTASGSIASIGSNPNGEPSDLYGMSRVRLLDANSLDEIAGFQFQTDSGSDSATFSGTLAAGRYVILATAQMYVFSADLLGPPVRSGSGSASATFSLGVVPTPGTAILLGFGAMSLTRRRSRTGA